MPRTTLRCSQCKNDFRREEIIRYTPDGCKTEYKLCKKCYDEKIARKQFSDTVCRIFNLKAPGSRIWNDRKRIIDTYGYTDDIICKTLLYLYEIKKIKKLSESLIMVTPSSVNEMKTWERNQNTRKNLFENMSHHEYKYEYIDIPDDEDEELTLDNPDDYLW